MIFDSFGDYCVHETQMLINLTERKGLNTCVLYILFKKKQKKL